MMHGLSLRHLNPFARCTSSADHRPPQPEWQTTRQKAARQILRQAPQLPVQSKLASQFSMEGAQAPGRNSQVLKDSLCLRPELNANGEPVPVGPQLLALSSPENHLARLAELVHLLKDRDVHHLLVLGKISTAALKPDDYVRSASSSYDVNGQQLVLTTSMPHWQDGLQTRTLSLRVDSEGQRGAAGLEANGPEGPSRHLLTLVEVEPTEAGLLSPDDLKQICDWSQKTISRGEPLAIVAREFPEDEGRRNSGAANPLLIMTGQLALTMSLRRELDAGSAPGQRRTPDQQEQPLARAAAELHRRLPSYLGNEKHLSAVLAACESPSGSVQSLRPRVQFKDHAVTTSQT
jgi:hypothetical protein